MQQVKPILFSHHQPPNARKAKNTAPLFSLFFHVWCKVALKRDFLAFGIKLSLNKLKTFRQSELFVFLLVQFVSSLYTVYINPISH